MVLNNNLGMKRCQVGYEKVSGTFLATWVAFVVVREVARKIPNRIDEQSIRPRFRLRTVRCASCTTANGAESAKGSAMTSFDAFHHTTKCAKTHRLRRFCHTLMSFAGPLGWVISEMARGTCKRRRNGKRLRLLG